MSEGLRGWRGQREISVFGQIKEDDTLSRDAVEEVQIARWVSAFDQTALILGRTDRCLVRSLAMFSILRGHGVSAALVIGVRSDPFSAHAWVQHDDIVLNDSVDQINNYAPILVLR